ncbi:alpha/beta hydrolase [Muriicola marianensis]|uniref:Alpha/beta hydrolase n=1 Tax=Muriicola marianensis TaxID=1324801 RepID=A0ABQ1QTL6_9FLAO|nr:alpha/beta hydrolase [Muriicola marianensis]GGD45403.1 alpha/beta hydrolase [Muriicola marianensis]
MKIKKLIIALTLLSVASMWSQTESEVELSTDTGILNGSLVLPNEEGKVPVVLIVAGSGPTDRNGNNPMMTNNSLQLLATGLAENGIASLRFDKRGVAGSTSAMTKEEDLRFETYIDDVVSWGKKLKEDPRFSEIIILGHSEGSLIGMIAADRIEADKFISIAGVGRPAADILREQLSAQPPVVTAMTDPILDTLEMGNTVTNVNPMLNSLFRPSVQPYLISWFKYDPAEEIARLDCPVLILQGTTDIQVKLKDADLLSAANARAEKAVLEGMNHVLKNAPEDRGLNIQTYNDSTLPLAGDLMETIVSFIKN